MLDIFLKYLMFYFRVNQANGPCGCTIPEFHVRKSQTLSQTSMQPPKCNAVVPREMIKIPFSRTNKLNLGLSTTIRTIRVIYSLFYDKLYNNLLSPMFPSKSLVQPKWGPLYLVSIITSSLRKVSKSVRYDNKQASFIIISKFHQLGFQTIVSDG